MIGRAVTGRQSGVPKAWVEISRTAISRAAIGRAAIGRAAISRTESSRTTIVGLRPVLAKTGPTGKTISGDNHECFEHTAQGR